MLVALDVGNTAITYGIFKKSRLIGSGSFLEVDIPLFIKECCKSGANCDTLFVISSVVPKITEIFNKYVRRIPGAKLRVIGRNLPVPLPHRYKSKGLGIDRLVTAYGALRVYRAPLLVLDFGTALTIDYVSAKGAFEGGLIIPGPEISFQALLSRAALIPKSLRLPTRAKGMIGRSTFDCISSGILQGYGAMADELVTRLKSKYSNKLKSIATGGFATHLKPFMKKVDVYDPLLSLKSIRLIYRDRKI